jgi:hypothetical protein
MRIFERLRAKFFPQKPMALLGVQPQQVYRFKNAEDDQVGLDVSLSVSNGMVMFDLSKPVQWIELNELDTKRLIASLIAAGSAAWAEEHEVSKPN